MSYFNSRPHGGRLPPGITGNHVCAFQLTPSRRATAIRWTLSEREMDFNSRPHGGRRSGELRSRGRLHISTHALTEGDRRRSHAGHCVEAHFNSRPHGGRRTHGQKHREKRTISTHALTEGDCAVIPGDSRTLFQLTPSRRATKIPWLLVHAVIFQLTPSRRATCSALFHRSVNILFQLTPSRRATFFDFRCRS